MTFEVKFEQSGLQIVRMGWGTLVSNYCKGQTVTFFISESLEMTDNVTKPSGNTFVLKLQRISV